MAKSFVKTYKVNFPNGVDLGGATYALYGLHPTRSFGFVIDEEGKIVYGYDLGYYYTRGSQRVSSFFSSAARHLENAKDPFGIGEVPAQCKTAYSFFKVGRYGDAKALAERLLKSSEAKEVAEKIIAAADKVEQEKFERMQSLAEAGEAGQLHEESKAFQIAFPKSKLKSKIRTLISKADDKGKGKDEAMAAKNFDRALMFLDRQRKQSLMLLKAIAKKYEGTYYGGLADTLSLKLK